MPGGSDERFTANAGKCAWIVIAERKPVPIEKEVLKKSPFEGVEGEPLSTEKATPLSPLVRGVKVMPPTRGVGGSNATGKGLAPYGVNNRPRIESFRTKVASRRANPASRTREHSGGRDDVHALHDEEADALVRGQHLRGHDAHVKEKPGASRSPVRMWSQAAFRTVETETNLDSG